MTQLSNILGICVVETMENYIGLLLLIRKNNTDAFRHIIDNFSNRIKGWTKRLLSYGGREVFSKFVLQSLPTYSLFVFLVLRGIVDAMVAKMKSFWWESKKRGHRWMMMKWEVMCLLKGMGVLALEICGSSTSHCLASWCGVLSTTKTYFATVSLVRNTFPRVMSLNQIGLTNHPSLGIAYEMPTELRLTNQVGDGSRVKLREDQ